MLLIATMPIPCSSQVAASRANVVAMCLRLLDAQLHADFFPVVIPNWDNTPRSGRKGRVLHGAHPDLFGAMMRAAVAKVAHRTPGQRLIILKSWNEWAEGNYVEPDLEFGHGWLEAIADAVLEDG